MIEKLPTYEVNIVCEVKADESHQHEHIRNFIKELLQDYDGLKWNCKVVHIHVRPK
jgi:hypothetical protein